VPAPLPVRADRDPAGPRRLARRERDGRAGARLPALADAPDGPPRGEAAGLAGATGRTLGDRAHRHDTAGVAGPRDRPRPGRPRALDEGRRAAPKAVVPRGPDLARDGRAARRARDLRAPVEARLGVRHREGGTPRPPEGLDPSRRKTRPVHPEAGPGAQARLEKARPAWRARRRTGAPGRLGSGCGPWARRGPGGRAASRASGAGRGRARAGCGGGASPRRAWPGRSARSAARASRRRCPRPRPRRRASSSPSRRARSRPGPRAAPVLDGAGRHAGGEPGVPPTPTLVHPPPHGPGPDPAGRAWERLRDRRLSRRAPAGGHEAVADAARAARDAPLAEPGRPRSPADFPRLPASVTTS